MTRMLSPRGDALLESLVDYIEQWEEGVEFRAVSGRDYNGITLTKKGLTHLTQAILDNAREDFEED